MKGRHWVRKGARGLGGRNGEDGQARTGLLTKPHIPKNLGDRLENSFKPVAAGQSSLWKGLLEHSVRRGLTGGVLHGSLGEKLQPTHQRKPPHSNGAND